MVFSLSFFVTKSGRWDPDFGDVWYICSLCWCCCKFSKSLIPKFSDFICVSFESLIGNFRWVWSFGQDGLIKLFGMLLYGTCMRFFSILKVLFICLKIIILLFTAFFWGGVLQSHHKPREGPFELNDVFAIVNAVPAIGLLSYGFFNKGLVPGLCFGAVSPLSLSLSQLVRKKEHTNLTSLV